MRRAHSLSLFSCLSFIFLGMSVIAAPSVSRAALPAICGNGGVACPEPDKDNDGILSTIDCDDNDYTIYPGVVTAKGCSGGQTHVCQGNGLYTACTAAPVCEASAGSTCKYIDCGSGNDSADGSFGSPWRSWKKVGFYQNSGSRPAGWYGIQPGDVIYLKGSGTCSEWCDPGGSMENAVLTIRTSGTPGKPITFKRYPGSTAVINPGFTSGTQGRHFIVDTASYFKFEDFDLTGSYAGAFYFDGASHVEVARTNCHDIKGVGANNVACLSAAGPNDFYIHHNSFSDVYDPASPRNENISLIVFFRGGNQRVEYNRLFYTNAPNYSGAVAGFCFKYKHPSDASGGTSIKGNQFWNCYNSAIFSCSSDLTIGNNLFVNSDTYEGAVFYKCAEMGGGDPHCRNNTIEYNTVVNARAYEQANAMVSSLGTSNFNHNVVVDNCSSYNSENGFMRLEHYGSDAQFNTFRSTPALVTNNNCYFNPKTTVTFDLAASSSGGTGGMYSLSQWKSLGYDSSSVVENPVLGSALNASSASCAATGWLGGTSGGARPAAPTGLSVQVAP